MKPIEKKDDKLRELFLQLADYEVSPNFENSLMLRIEKLAQKKKRSRNLSIILAIVTGLTLLVGGLWWLFDYFDILHPFLASWSTISFPSYQFPDMEISPPLIYVTVSVFALLVSDLLIRRHYFMKKK